MDWRSYCKIHFYAATCPKHNNSLTEVAQHPTSRYRLRSSQSNQLVVPPVKLSTYGPRSFDVAGPTTWNSLPEYLRDPELSIDTFRRHLKTFLFAQYWRRHSSALETFVPSRSINLLFTLHYITTRRLQWSRENCAIITAHFRNGQNCSWAQFSGVTTSFSNKQTPLLQQLLLLRYVIAPATRQRRLNHGNYLTTL